jgi:glutamate-ammonia-ligase adenylyltransferase
MSEFLLLESMSELPRPADPRRVALGLERWREQASASGDDRLTAFAERLAADATGGALLAAIFGNSPFLTQCLLLDMAYLPTMLGQAPERTLGEVVAETGATASAGGGAELMAVLRRAKRRVALLVAVLDIGGIWDLGQVTAALSDFAQAAIAAATRHALGQAVRAGELAVADEARPEEGSGFSIIAMGKLGARELNYSSDIDLIVLYDSEAMDYRGGKSLQDCCVRLTREVVNVLHERTAEGYVFRTDLRLRPDAGVTPMALSMNAAENYYESLGQNWERAAMIKARAIAGDVAAGEKFLDRIGPFTWRKYLDYAAIQDIHSIKRQMHAVRGHATVATMGHNIKLGRGGIREIEFFAQTQQLIAGGRDRRLRAPTTRGAIQALAASGRIAPEVAEELIAAYVFLRRLEHRLQMIADEQTHTLPREDKEFAALGVFMGYDNVDAFVEDLLGHLGRVQGHYAALFEEAPALGLTGRLAFTGTDDDPETLETIAALGFSHPGVVAAGLRNWHHGRYRATRSTRARELLTELTPALLQAFARTVDPDAAFVKVDEFLGKLPAGVQLFSLFHANPSLLDLVAEVMGSAPRLATYLSRKPLLLDGVLGADFFGPLPRAGDLADDLARALEAASDFEDILDITREWAAERKFQAGLHVMRDITDADAAGPALTDVAEVLIRALLPLVEAEFASVHGQVASGAMAVAGLGKFGGREMSAGSDLDIIFIYDCSDEVEASDGPKALAVTQYYARLSQRLIAALTALTGEGRLYEVDTRLRPSGKSGPIATSLAAFELYHRASAWTWEHMALTRARVVAGPPDLAERIADAIRRVLVLPRDGGKLAADIAEMRERVWREHGSANPWQIKHARGGLVDLEFLCQYLQLRHAAERPEVLDTNTSAAYGCLAEAGALAPEAARELIAATVQARNIQGLLRLCSDGPFNEKGAPDGLRAALARAGKAPDFDALRQQLTRTQEQTVEHFETLIEAPAAVWRGRGQGETES